MTKTATLLTKSQLKQLNDLPTVCVTGHGYYFKLNGTEVCALKQTPKGWASFGKFESVAAAFSELNN